MLVTLVTRPQAIEAQEYAYTLAMPPSVTSSTLGQGEQKITWVFRCIDFEGQFLDCTIAIDQHQAVAFSGGHEHHNGSRPKGRLSDVSGNTGGAVGFSTTLTAPEVSGVISFAVTYGFPALPPKLPAPTTVTSVYATRVEIPGLVPLPPGSWTPYGAVSGQHADNHYGTPSMNGVALLLADAYALAFPGEKLRFNDMSLVQGGLFDVYGDNLARIWKTPHGSHRFGEDMDIGLVPAERRFRLGELLKMTDLDRVLEPPPLTHWHLRLRD